MKKILFSVMAICMAASTFGQHKHEGGRVCGTLEHEKFLEKKDPLRKQKREEYEKKVQEYLAKRKADPNAKNLQTTQTIQQIPLVVHLVYSSATDSISTAQIFSQIQILNDDFTRQNADAVNTPSTFTSVASGPMVNYCWATRDPNGNPTNGIEYRKSTTTSWTTDDKVKSFATGGLDAWDPTRYFNIWVCNLGGGLLGYGEFPTGSVSQTYGFVAGYFCFGNCCKAQAPYDKGRTATHEIGHCFNLIHIWGDEPACAQDDACNDTPLQADKNFGCPTYPHTDACQASAPGVMYMNYMDYTDDACMNIFTVDQSARMNGVINTAPYNALKTSNGCLPLTLPPVDAGISNINSPVGTVCAATFTPNVTLKNWGANNLTSATINYKVDNGTVATFNWNGNLASLATTTVNLPAVTTTAGTHTFTAYTSNPNSSTDGNASNDVSTSTFNVISGSQSLPYFEGFEGSTFPPNGMSVTNPDAGITWARDTWAHKTGVASAYMDDANYSSNGQIDDLNLPNLNFSGSTSVQLQFQVAYQLYTDPSSSPNYSDTLQVLLSTDCGATWNSVYKKFGVALTTATPVFSTTTFTPTAAQWRQETVNLNAYNTAANVMIKFRNITDYENDMYLDDINITGTVGIKNDAASVGVYIYPNPSTNGKFTVDVRRNENEVNKLSVFDVLGNKVYEIDQKIPSGTYDMDLSHLSGGTYFVEVIKDNKPAFTKIVISK